MTNEASEIFITAVTSALNEEENIAQLVKEVHDAFESMGKPWEMIVTNDGSTDRTGEILKELMTQYPQLSVVTMKKRSGQTNGFDAGIRRAKGTLVVTMDADLQNNPADIPNMVKALQEGGWDMVNGFRAKRNDPWIRLASTKIANGTRNWLTRENIQDSACGLKLFKRHCLDRIKLFNGMHRFMATLVKIEGYKVTEVEVTHRARVAGTSKYGVLDRLFVALRDTFAVRWMQSRTILYDVEEME
jgi:dolichol-phosphate mannosyltransferase